MSEVLKEIKNIQTNTKVTFKKFFCHVEGVKGSVHIH